MLDNIKAMALIITTLMALMTFLGYEFGNKNKAQAVEKIIVVKDSQIAGIATSYREVCQ